ncbi:MAG TPA: hypothetical protein PKW55_00115 [Spirochaetota bacterium]|nr:hypothetical protein [Spirochaetota bacterium]HOM37762.1 hypothetical protein [Spirochaetota bacterium]HPQ49361.1 hypothetical protein [Spirochaetota bacterium]
MKNFNQEYNKNKEIKTANIQIEFPKKDILGKCLICDKNVSDLYYSFNIEEKGYIHFECLIKYVKEIAYNMKIKNFKIVYLGGKKFGIINERGEKGKWNIIRKVDIEEILEILKQKNMNLKY